MSAISIADDAASWYESGMVKDLTIRNNLSFKCGEPVIIFCPENKQSNGAVHQNISIVNNKLDLQGLHVLSAKNTGNIKFEKNTIKTGASADIKDMIQLKNCGEVRVLGNTINE